VIAALVEEKRRQLAELCLRHHVRRFELFGSAAAGRFDPARSDLDFLVEFQDLPPAEYAQSYFALLHALEDLFDRPIDLVTVRSLTNPYFVREIERDRTVLYAA
jgi:predicted nucleotidyltransferase